MEKMNVLMLNPSANHCRLFILSRILNAKARNKLERGMLETAFDMVDAVTFPENWREWDSVKTAILNGAESFREYAMKGAPLRYNVHIANRFFTKKEAAKVARMEKAGEHFDYLDFQWKKGVLKAYMYISNLHYEYVESVYGTPYYKYAL